MNAISIASRNIEARQPKKLMPENFAQKCVQKFAQNSAAIISCKRNMTPNNTNQQTRLCNYVLKHSGFISRKDYQNQMADNHLVHI